ncbi:hypothetical protein [Streptomyces sp. NPDC054854]
MPTRSAGDDHFPALGHLHQLPVQRTAEQLHVRVPVLRPHRSPGSDPYTRRPAHAASMPRSPPPHKAAPGGDATGLSPRDVSAFKPRDVRSLVRATRGHRRGSLTDEQLPQTVEMVLDPDGAPL